MALNLDDHEGGDLIDYVDAAIRGMAEDLTEGDLAIIGVVRKSALAYDMAIADGKPNAGMAYLAYVTNGMEKLGGSRLARKQLGDKPEKPKQGLAAVRALRAVDAPDPDAAPKPKRTTRKRA